MLTRETVSGRLLILMERSSKVTCILLSVCIVTHRFLWYTGPVVIDTVSVGDLVVSKQTIGTVGPNGLVSGFLNVNGVMGFGPSLCHRRYHCLNAQFCDRIGPTDLSEGIDSSLAQLQCTD